jgi:putative hydrolase of the HAD superfamily
MTLKGAIFDLDGTLYFSEPLEKEVDRSAVSYIAEIKGMDENAARELIHTTRRQFPTPSGAAGTLSMACLALGGSLMEMHRRFAEEIDPKPLLSNDYRVVEMLAALSGVFPLYLYTNNNRILADKIMHAIGISHLFRKVFTIEESWLPKPDHRELRRVLADTGLEAREALFVGDRYDIDLRLPHEMGAAVHLVRDVEDLLSLRTYLATDVATTMQS